METEADRDSALRLLIIDALAAASAPWPAEAIGLIEALDRRGHEDVAFGREPSKSNAILTRFVRALRMRLVRSGASGRDAESARSTFQSWKQHARP